ncbi:MFS transporter, partial [Xanthomonas citri pv. citri]
ALYLSATAATAFSWSVASYALFRFLTGAGIGGEYTAINSTIQELVPARYRGWTDLVINGSFWIGAAMGAVAAIVLLDPNVIGPDLGWRLAYLIGASIGLVVLLMRMWIPESPRWLMIHGQPDQAHAIVDEIERSVIGHDQDA